MEHEKLLKTAEKAAFAGGEILKKYFRGVFDVEIKRETSPLVSQADRESEQIIRDIIRTEFPSHIIIGEEFGEDRPIGANENTITWILDPLDGTSAFTAGLPTFVVLIGVWQGNNPLLGIIYQPITGEMWIGDGEVCTLNGITVSNPSQNHPFILATTSPDFLKERSKEWFYRVKKEATVTLMGGDGHLYASLASGRISCIIEEGLKWHDVAALVPIITGAGGVLTDFEGKSLKTGAETYQVLACCYKDIHNLALSLKGG